MNWEAHITKLISKANRKIGLIWKISGHLPRICAENMYSYYIRPVLVYGSTIYDNCSKQLREKLEDTQRRAGIACTRAFYQTPTKVLLSELGWSTLETRRSYMRLLQMYKMKNHHVPNYLRTILPPPQCHYSNYPTRFHNNFMVPHTKTAKCHEAFITKTTLGWNSLDEETKDCTSINTFKKLQKKKLFPTKTQYLSKGKSKYSINHMRMRLGLSHLKQQLNSFGIIDTPYCDHCTSRLEMTTHYLMNCPRYTDIRDDMLRQIWGIVERYGMVNENNLRYLNKLLLEGDNRLTENENIDVFKIVETFIEKSK